MSKYGHLRPNSYNIESYSYKERPNYYLPSKKSKLKSRIKSSFHFDVKTEKALEEALHEMDFNMEKLFLFIDKAISAREFSKFQFTKSLSLILDLIVKYGKYHKFSRNEMSFISIQDILKIGSKGLYENPRQYIENMIAQGSNWYSKSKEIQTPSLISSSSGLEIIEKDENLPNFISNENIIGEPFYLEDFDDKLNISNKIIMIESADPGYDWIFLYNIKGLVTMYGGAASHMTIRCNEFGLPAAIGCGVDKFNELKSSNLINLDCSSKNIIKLK